MRLQALSFFFDIDETITRYRPGALAADRLLDGNFLFPIIRDMLAERGVSSDDAAAMIRREAVENVFWCYGDFIRKFGLRQPVAAERFRIWHRENLDVFPDTVELIRSLAAEQTPLYIVSNNPVDGCRMKLERAGLDPELFRGIFGTDVMKGCKHLAASWERALNLAGVRPESVVTVGDDVEEDGVVPRSCGVGVGVILERDSALRIRRADGFLHVNDARVIPGALTGTEF